MKSKSEIEALVRNLEKTKENIGKQRDNLREHFSDLEDLLQSLDDSEYLFDTGIDSIRDGLEELSKYL